MTANTVDESNQPQKKKLFSGSIVFVSMIVVVFLCCIGLISTIRNYALSLAELHALQRDESALKDKKQALNNDVERWKDKAYVAAQARERLGFIFPGEQAVRVEHPEAITVLFQNRLIRMILCTKIEKRCRGIVTCFTRFTRQTSQTI